MQLINKVLHDHLYMGVLMYLGSCIIFSETLEEHIKVVCHGFEKAPHG